MAGEMGMDERGNKRDKMSVIKSSTEGDVVARRILTHTASPRFQL